MADRPILFSGPMVRALLAGTKTQTRRPVKYPVADGKHGWHPVPTGFEFRPGGSDRPVCPYGRPGDRLWVREAWRAPAEFNSVKPSDLTASSTALLGTPIVYEASRHESVQFGKLRPSMFMPRWACRLELEITGVRVERLQDISDADAAAEGTPCYVCGEPMTGISEADCHCFHRKAMASDYRALWENINGAGSWDANPWVWVVEFRRIAP